MAVAELELVAKKKTSGKKPTEPDPDQHVSGFMIRLPEEYRDILRKIKAKTGRAMTVATQMALEREARALGVDFTPNWPERS